MSYERSLFIISSIFFIDAHLSASAQSHCRSNWKYRNNSRANINAVINSSYMNIDDNGFCSVSVGQGVYRVNGVVLCRGDTLLGQCRNCIRTVAADLLRQCQNEKQATGWGEFCMVRYSNQTIYGAMASSPSDHWPTPQDNATSPVQFRQAMTRLLDNLRNQAASGGSLRKVAAGNISGPDSQTIFALVQCTPDLYREDCSRCLIGAQEEIPKYCDRKTGCTVLWPSCNLRFQISEFFNGTRLQESESDGKKDGNQRKLVVSIVVPIGVCIIILAASASIVLRKRMRQGQQNLRAADMMCNEESQQYDFGKIRAATNDFAEANKLGQGGFGAVYRGRLLNGLEIAVKRLAMNSGQGDIEFKNEVLLVAKLQHRNLVRLLGFSMEKAERALIYEFVQNASLDHFIFDLTKRSSLDWDKRYKIILGIARGLTYLHEDSRLKIIHRDLKASNVLLDADMNPKIADFGMAKLFEQDETQRNTSRIVGTYGYMAPEYAMHGHFSVKSDVFSFGVLVLEIISGQRNNYTRNGEIVEDLLTSTWKNWQQGTLENTIDPILLSNVRGSMREMLRCIHMGLLCVQENATDRPTMTSIVLMLSSSTMTLIVPTEPAFYMASRFGPDVALSHELYTEDSNSSKASNAKAVMYEGST